VLGAERVLNVSGLLLWEALSLLCICIWAWTMGYVRWPDC